MASFTSVLLRALRDRTAKVVCSMAPYAGVEMIWDPRSDTDSHPWRFADDQDVESMTFRYTGRECHSVPIPILGWATDAFWICPSCIHDHDHSDATPFRVHDLMRNHVYFCDACGVKINN